MSAASAFTPRCVLITGGAGFIGSNLVRWILDHDAQARIVNLDLLSYAGNLENLTEVAERHGPDGDGRYYFVRGDIRDPDTVAQLLRGYACESRPKGGSARTTPAVDAVVHLAAESHVDRSIMNPAAFVDTNVRGSATLLDGCRAELAASPRPFRFVHVSTDEVYGSLGPSDPPFTEATPLAPNSPYSASKAGADCLVRAYVETFGLPAITARCSNNYGPYQFPEKLIPLTITRALEDAPVPIYGNGMQVRDWLHVDDHAAALWAILTCGHPGQVYNIGGETQARNLDVVRTVLELLRKPLSLIRHVPDRPGHDARYAMDVSRLKRQLGWAPRHKLPDGLAATVEWYLAHRGWWERVLTEAYRAAATLYLTERG